MHHQRKKSSVWSSESVSGGINQITCIPEMTTYMLQGMKEYLMVSDRAER